MSTDSVATTQQTKPTGGGGADITDLVTRDLAERKAAGTAKYGQPLRGNNGRDPLIDLYQELLDCLYARQAIEERRTGGQA